MVGVYQWQIFKLPTKGGVMGNLYMVWPKDLPSGMTCKVIKCDGQCAIEFSLEGRATAVVGVGQDEDGKRWATIYRHKADDDSSEVELLRSVFHHYKVHDFDCAYAFANTTRLKGVLFRLGIKEREKYERIYRLDKQDVET